VDVAATVESNPREFLHAREAWSPARIVGMSIPVKTALSWATLMFAAGFASAANRCVDAKGRVTYQDAPCPDNPAGRPLDTSDAFSAKPNKSTNQPPASTKQPSDPAYATAKGTWRGPAQFQYTLGGIRDGAAQTVTPMVVELKEDGEVVGLIGETGCRISGLATQFITPSMANVDVSLKSCKDPRFNARFTGHLTSSAGAREAKLALNAISWQVPTSKVQQASLEAVLRR